MHDTGVITFTITELYGTLLTPHAQTLLFFAFALAFAIKVPLFPLHTWLPDAHVEAPTGGSIILAGVMLKMGTYGFLRFVLPFFPDATAKYAGLLIALAVIGIVYGALVAWVQPDMKKLVAYSSVSHLGFCVLGIFALNQTSIEGSILQMVNHGLSTGALFLCVGVIYERRHTRLLADYGGLAKTMPVFATFFIIAMLSSVGLPGLNGFVGEFLILAGSFQTASALRRSSPRPASSSPPSTCSGSSSASSSARSRTKRTATSPRSPGTRSPRSCRWSILMVWIGVHPNTFLRKMTPSVQQLLQIVHKTDAEQSDGREDRRAAHAHPDAGGAR